MHAAPDTPPPGAATATAATAVTRQSLFLGILRMLHRLLLAGVGPIPLFDRSGPLARGANGED